MAVDRQAMGITDLLELDRFSGRLFILVLCVLSGMMILPYAFAQPVLVSVVQSDACEKSTTCIKLKDLVSLDTTDQKISGKLKQIMSGDYIRTKPAYKNHWEFYRYSNQTFIVCIQCDLGFQTHAKQIVIESNPSFKYVLQSDHIIVNNTRYEYNGRYIDSCSSAHVSSDLDLIKDTVQFMGNNCKIPSKYNEKTTITKPKTPMLDCSYACMNAKFFKDAKAKSKSTYLIQPDIKLKKQNDKVRLN